MSYTRGAKSQAALFEVQLFGDELSPRLGLEELEISRRCYLEVQGSLLIRVSSMKSLECNLQELTMGNTILT